MAQIWPGKVPWSQLSIHAGCAGVLIVYDITRHSISHVKKWLKKRREHTDPSIVVMLIGNKSALQHLVAISTGRDLILREGVPLLHGNYALEATNVDNAFTKALRQMWLAVSNKKTEAGGV